MAVVRRPERLAAVSIDLDEIGCYSAIHGLPPPPEGCAHAIYERAVARLAALFEREDVPATWFVIGRDALRPENAATLRTLARRGDELANHSNSHYYDLTRRPRDVMEREVRDANDAIERASGQRPVGFRAPGYTVNDALLDVVHGAGMLYDSSVFPCPAYYGAKATALGWMTLRRRASRSILDDPRVLGAPADPYRIGRPYTRRGDGLVELPIGVTRGARLPYIGTSLVLGGASTARALTRLISSRPLVNLELHGIDLADAREDGLEWLAPNQPDLRRTVGDKETSLRAAIRELRATGHRFVTLSEAARRVT